MRSRPRVNTIREARRGVMSSPRLRAPLAKIDPEAARKILTSTDTGEPMSRRQQRKFYEKLGDNPNKMVLVRTGDIGDQ